LSLYLLAAAALATSVFHTLIPDHWLPFVLIGRARSWSLKTTAAVAGFSAFIHVVFSLVIAGLAIVSGRRAAEIAGATLERAGGVLLVGFGLLYAIWAWRKGGHFHPGGVRIHRKDETPDCDGLEGHEHPEHLHYHADERLISGDAGRGGLSLAVIVGLNPCLVVLPILLAAIPLGPGPAALVALAYSIPTIVLNVGLSVAGVAGTRRLELPGAARHMEALSGLLIAVVGVAFLLLER
jgi:ABC-type nickel/cobalt efflux system permease component RcnA